MMGFLCLAAPANVCAKNSSRQTIKIAFPYQSGISISNENGTKSGYNYDYLQKISEYTGWKLDFITYNEKDVDKQLEHAFKDVREGDADLIGPVFKNKQSVKEYEFPQRSYGSAYTTLSALDSSDLYENNVREKKLLKVGVLKDTKERNKEVAKFLKAEDITYKLYYYDSQKEEIKALREGEIQLLAGSSLTQIRGTRVVEKFSAKPYYFVTGKGNKKLIHKLDKALKQLNQVQPYMQEDLYYEYFRDSSESYELTTKQKQYLKNKKELKVLCLDKDAPYVYKKKGKAAGMIVSMLNDFADKYKLEIQYTFCSSREAAKEIVNKKKYDIMIGIPFTTDYCTDINFVRSDSVINSTIAYLRKPYKSKSKNQTIAIIKGMGEYIDIYKYKKIVWCDDSEECIRAVKDGKADVGLGDRSALEYYMYDMYSDLVTNQVPDKKQDICVAVSKERDMKLLAILNPYIHSISEQEKTTYLTVGNIHTHKVSLSYIIRKNPVQVIVITSVFVVLCATAVFILLYSRKMRRKNEELRMANEVKSEFLTRMSHDIRTPMNGIMGMLDIADKKAEQGDWDAVRICYKKIKTAAMFLLALINDILDMSKLESREISFTEESVDLKIIMKNSVSILENQAAEHGITIILEDDETFMPPYVLSSELHLHQIFMNIIGNAIKYNKANGMIICGAKVAGQDSNTISCRFHVKDTGIGMSEEFQKHMFERFTQEQGEARSEYKGTGLGLAIVKQIIDQMDGEIHVDSKLGVGTDITWILNFKIDKQHKEEIQSTISNEQVDLRGTKILVAEDNALNAEIIQFMLEEMGIESDVACDGEDVVNQFEKSDEYYYDYILMDIMMPKINGYEACRVVRGMKRKDAKTIPIIALTAKVFQEDIQQARKAGMNAYITKPVDAERIKEELEKLYRKKS